MRIPRWSFACATLACVALAQCGKAGVSQTPKVRPMAVAGAPGQGFYPSDPKLLGQMIDGFMANAKQEPLDPVAIVVPHAGYEYAGQVAAYSWAAVKGKKIDRVVIIAPSHYEAFNFASVYDGSAYTTPFGQVPVDRAFAAKLANGSSITPLGRRPHAGAG